MKRHRRFGPPALAIALSLAGMQNAAAQQTGGAQQTPSQPLYGAIAYSPETGAHGWSTGNTTRGDAEEDAQTNCLKHASDCRLATWFRDACGALAVGGGGWGAHWGNSREEAETAAISACSEHTRNCRVVQWHCTPGH